MLVSANCRLISTQKFLIEKVDVSNITSEHIYPLFILKFSIRKDEYDNYMIDISFLLQLLYIFL